MTNSEPRFTSPVQACRDAGIAVKMITGDHLITAGAIGEQLGLGDADGAIAGAALARLDDDGLREAAAGRGVFARVAPEHKLRLVEALQDNGQVVSMTGDGVNDAQALERICRVPDPQTPLPER